MATEHKDPILTNKQKIAINENLDLIKRIIAYEEEQKEHYEKQGWSMWWDYADVRGEGRILYNLFQKGILDMPHGASGKRKSYCLSAEVDVKQYVLELENILLVTQKNSTENDSPPIPRDIFSLIIGYSEIKKILELSINSDKPVHILLEGPPSSAKSLFLMELERLANSVFLYAGNSTRAGIRELLIDLPRYLIIDEIDKISNPQDLSPLLSWMEDGRFTITKHNQHSTFSGKGWVFGACNTLRGIKPELLSRFLHFKLKPYTKGQYLEITTNILEQREGVDIEVARYIAEKTVSDTNDVRTAIKVARLAKTIEEVDDVLRIVRKYN